VANLSDIQDLTIHQPVAVVTAIEAFRFAMAHFAAQNDFYARYTSYRQLLIIIGNFQQVLVYHRQPKNFVAAEEAAD
jgi:hypothetical protein